LSPSLNLTMQKRRIDCFKEREKEFRNLRKDSLFRGPTSSKSLTSKN